MEVNTFARLASFQVLSFLIVFTLLSSSNPKIASACNSTSTIPSYSNQTSNYSNTAIPSYSHNTTNPSNQTSSTTYKNTTNTSTSYQTYKTFVLTSCNSSTYPSICYHYLSPYASKIEANPLKLCNVSLSLVLKAARKTSSLISEFYSSKNITEKAASVLKDCLDNVKDSIEEIKQSLDEMNYLEGIDKAFHMSSIQTYMSAAITDDVTCSDEFDEENIDGKMRDRIRKSILNVQWMTSNALYFINNLKY